MTQTLDRYDWHILQILQDDGRISNQELADRIGLSPSPCLRRVKALEESGLITGYRALVDAKKFGLTLMALIHIAMDQHTPERFAASAGDPPDARVGGRHPPGGSCRRGGDTAAVRGRPGEGMGRRRVRGVG